MKKLLLGLLVWSSVAIAQTFPVNNLRINGSVSGNVTGTGNVVLSTNPSIVGGTLDNSVIGGVTPNAAAFTTLSVSTPNPGITFQSLGSGAVGRPLQSKLGDIISVRDFGADNTGATNATTAIQSAITYACTFPQGATVFLPSGQYLVNTGTFNSPCNGLKIQGAGVQNTILNVNASATNANLFSFNFTTGSGVYDLYINYLGTPSAGVTIENNSAYNFTVQNVRINGAWQAIGILGLGVPQFYNNLEIVNTQTGGTGIYINGGSDQYFNNVLIYSPSTTPSSCVHIQNSGGLFINGLDAVQCQTGLLIDPPNGSSVAWLSVVNADFDTSAQHGIYFNPATGGTVFGSNFVNVWASSNGGIGVYLSSAGGTVDGVRFDALRAFNNRQDGLVMNATSGTVQHVSISDSDFAGNSQSSFGTYNGVTIGANMSSFSITGCRSGQMAGYAVSQGYGILINTGTSNHYIVTSNNTNSNITGGTQDNGSGANKAVANNL